MDLNEETVGHLADRVAVSLGEQAELHLELVKAELARDVSALGRDLLPLATAIPLLVVGYALVCVAAALALAPWIGAAGGFALFGAVNLLVAGVAIRRGLSHLRARPLFAATVGYELEQSAKGLVTALRHSPVEVEVSHVR